MLYWMPLFDLTRRPTRPTTHTNTPSRTSDVSVPRLPGAAGLRNSLGAPLGPWAGQAQSLGTTQLGTGLVRAGQAGETVGLSGGTAVGTGRGVGAMWGAGVGNGAAQPPWNNTAV